VPQPHHDFDSDHHLQMHFNNQPHSHHQGGGGGAHHHLDPHHNFKEDDDYEDFNDRHVIDQQ
jgi:hypothetical protein